MSLERVLVVVILVILILVASITRSHDSRRPTASQAIATDTEIITHLSLWDSDTTGDPWWIVEMLSPSAVIAGTTTRLATGLLVLQFAIWS